MPIACLRSLATGAIVIAAGILGGCAIHSSPISFRSEQRLREREVNADKLGFQRLPGGRRYEMQHFRARLPEGPVEIPMERGVARLPAARVVLNHDRVVRMILDTGAQLSVVEADSAIKAKADVFAPRDGTFRVAGVGGEERAWIARFDSAQLGPIEFEGLVAVLRRSTSDLHFGGFHLGSISVNLLGAPVLGAFSHVTFDYPRERLVFSGRTAFVPSRGAVRIPLIIRDSLPHVPLRIGGHSILAMVDTGARDDLFLNEEIVRRWGMEPNAQAGGRFKAAGLGGMIRGRQFRIPLIQIGGLPVKDVIVDSSTGPWQARIGSGLLERWCATFDYRNGALWLEAPRR